MSAPAPSASPPPRSAEQRRAALAEANKVRSQRAALKADLRVGKCSLAALLAEPPAYLAAARVLELLLAVPGYGPIKAGHLLERCQVSPDKTLAGLSARQRRRLIAALES